MIMDWLAALLLAVSTSGAPQDGRAQLDAFAEDLETLSGRFEQVTVDADGRVTEESSGELYYARPDRFRWSYGEPFPQEIVADGEQLWHYDISLEQVTVREQPGAAESPLLVLTRPELLDRFYRVTDSGSEVIEFEPLEDGTDIVQGRLYFRDGLPRQLELEDDFGQLTRLRLLELERNPEISRDVFEFTVPDGVDVLEGY
ncbi:MULTISPECIES: outer membrane lipoprotein chaperone LolA [unclassified Wenzhouxiangella]|uniref:outer membrane lipoprotein chaperone LolA n=1 Tax=unclassified Wenzhouxiangella TaxID=2613841 RepID=UPI000E32590A|nr:MULTISPECIES: outer membrane lipoprotein chaperone LolA [unclassified Wenzhouxiangella]RFF28631.1 outer membrane lipoprotein carrier protein LolA [Wenzhouxiangella sp. 15181]RFP68946.1 outer membrane lipoprotein carrier protein LolA [Wenzhouxiangella sp. 15190]